LTALIAEQFIEWFKNRFKLVVR